MTNNLIIKGNCFFNLGTVIFIGLNILYTIIVVIKGLPFELKTAVFLFLMEVLFFFFVSASLFYFVFEDDSLLVRNCWRFWYKKRIKINSIKKIVVDPLHKAGIGIRIATDKKKYVYPCGYMLNKDLVLLAKVFIEKGVITEVNVFSIKDKLDD